MKSLSFKISIASLLLFSGAVQSQDIPDKKMQVLEHKLQLRDKAVIELLERVESLERRVGNKRVEKQSSQSTEQKRPKAKQAPGSVVVNEEDAERALERSLTVEGALLLPSGALEIETGLAYNRREESAPGFITVGTQVFAGEIEVNANTFSANLGLRLGLPGSYQMEIGLPYRRSKLKSVTNIDFAPTAVAKQSRTSVGDVSIGFAKTLLREKLWQPDLVGRFTWDTDSSDENSFQEFRWSLTAIKRQDPVTFIGGLSYQHSIEDYNADNELIKPGSVTSMNFGSLIALSPETSMRFIISTSYQNETRKSGIKVDGSDRTIASLMIGGSTLLAPGTLLNFSVGIGLTDDADDFSIALSLPIRLDEKLF